MSKTIFFEKRNLLLECQYRFRQKRCESNCVYLLSSITTKQLLYNKTYTLHLQTPKRHSIQSTERPAGAKYSTQGLAQILWKQCKLYINTLNHVYFTKTHFLNFFNVDSGIKQEEALFLILFLLVINDMENVLSNGNHDYYVKRDPINVLMLLLLMARCYCPKHQKSNRGYQMKFICIVINGNRVIISKRKICNLKIANQEIKELLIIMVSQ